MADIDDDDYESRFPAQPIATADKSKADIVGIMADGTEVFMTWHQNAWVRSMGGGEIGEVVDPVFWRDC